MPTLRALALILAALFLCKSPAMAFDLFATHEVTVQFATADGKPMADAEVSVYAPGDPTHVVKTGKTDKDGKFEFGTDRDGLWTAEARISGDIARATVRVGSGSGSDEDQGAPSPYWVFGALGALLVLAVCFRFLRARNRRRGV
jgi:nickel transport protein